MESVKVNSKEALSLLQTEAERILAPLGYEIVCLEFTGAPRSEGRTLALYIDFINNESGEKKIGLDDCIKVNQAVDELFENTTYVDENYNLEVSSPGVERPIRKPVDFGKFSGRKIRIHTFRALTAEELENATYWKVNPRQKNFLGVSTGLNSDATKVLIRVDKVDISIPLNLISKANLEYVELGKVN